MTLLYHCPDTLQELSLTNLGGKFWKSTIEVTCPATTPDITWRALVSLKSLRIECQMIANLGDAILLPLLKHSCPNLKQFAIGIVPEHLCSAIMKTLVVSCPSIVHLEIHELNLPLREMLRLVHSYIGLQQVDIGVSPSMLDQAIPTLIRTSGATLTRVCIVERQFSIRKHLYPAYSWSIVHVWCR
ncbi:MAG: hypothetical protein J3R72DRAFT_514796 [Linnemannia gamsii]|nr:MAG: hypothetical protein J3R72DRAFT_514796 [Linnemannia gamsii]